MLKSAVHNQLQKKSNHFMSLHFREFPIVSNVIYVINKPYSLNNETPKHLWLFNTIQTSGLPDYRGKYVTKNTFEDAPKIYHSPKAMERDNNEREQKRN